MDFIMEKLRWKNFFKLNEKTPFSDEAYKNYFQSKERIQEANYKLDLKLIKLKPSL